MSRLPNGLSPQQMTAFQTFFDQVKDESLESKELAEFTRLVLGGTSITSRNEANESSYRRHTEGDRWAQRKFAGVYGAKLLEKGTVKDFLTINSAMGSSKADAIDKKAAKILRDAKNWEKSWQKHSSTGWYSTLPAEQLADYTAQEKARADEKIRVFSNNTALRQVVAFRQSWQPTIDTLTYAKKQMKAWNRERREAKKAAKPPMIGGVQMPTEYFLVKESVRNQIEDLINDGIKPQYEQWKVDQHARVSDLLTQFDADNTDKVWTDEEMFTRYNYRETCNVHERYFKYGNITPSHTWRSKDRTWAYTGLKEGWQDMLTKDIHEMAEMMRLQFIGYMMEKVLPVVAIKDSEMVDATNYIDRAPRFGEYVRFNFAFADESSFDLEGCVEQSYSSRGLPFFRFPRRFYNATLPTGVKLKKGKMTPFKTMVQVFCQQ